MNNFRKILFLLLIVSVYLSTYYFLNTMDNESLERYTLYIFLGIILMVQIIYYMLFNRTKIYSKSTIITLMLWTTILTYGYFNYFNFAHPKYLIYLFAILEGLFFIYFVYKLNKIIVVYKVNKNKYYYPDEALHYSIEKIFGTHPILKILFSEVSLFLYAILGWKLKVDSSKGDLFYYYKTTQYIVLFWVIFISTIFTIPVFHFLLIQWSPVIAWIVTGVTIYSLIWFIGDYYMIKNKPIILTDSQLIIRIGSRWSTDIDLSNIKTIKISTSDTPEEYEILSTTNETNTLMDLHKPIEIKGLFGFTKITSNLVLYVDEPHKFIKSTSPTQEAGV